MLGVTVPIALRSLRRNPLRTLLTMLGVVIGVAAVISMLAMVGGAMRRVQESIQSLGTHMLFVWAQPPRTQGVSAARTQKATLKPEDVRAIVQECPSVKAASGVDVGRAQCVYQGQNWSTAIMGVSPEYPEVRGISLSAGRWFSEGEVVAQARVCVLGSESAAELFGQEDPVGNIIRVRGDPFLVIGVLESKGGTAGGDDQDDRVFAPYTTVMNRIDHQPYLDFAMISARDDESIDKAAEEITALLRQRWRVPEDEPDNFQIHTQTQIAQQASQQGAIMTLFLGGVAAISLLVGGIGIMNVMLVSVTERIREIGIRLAVGARARDILLQFLAEAIMLSTASGLVGVALGCGVASMAATWSNWPFYVSHASIALALGFSVLVGITFGLYPALKASRLDPIEALRTE